MKLMIYASPFDKTAGKMVKHLCRRYRGSDTVYLPSLGEVEVYLRQPSYLGRLMVLMPKDRNELDALNEKPNKAEQDHHMGGRS